MAARNKKQRDIPLLGSAEDGTLPAMDTVSPVANSEITRSQKSRMKTRQRLIEAAFRVIAKKGVENSAINEITEEADVGFGSFYNHFKSKDEIAHAAFVLKSSDMASAFDELNYGVTDPAVKLSRNYRRIAAMTREDPVWGWFIVHANFSLRSVRELFWSRMIENLEQGLAQGRYRLKGIVTAGDMAFGALFAILRSILDGNATPNAEVEMVELLLRMLGIPPEEAAVLARDPLPERSDGSPHRK